MTIYFGFTSAIIAGFMTQAIAQPVQTDQEKRLQEIEQQLQSNEKNADEIKQDVPQRERELAGLRARLIETADSLKASETKSTSIEMRLQDLEVEALLVQEDLDQQQRDISDVLAALQSLEWSKPPALAVSPDDAAQAARAAMALSATVPDLQVKVDELQAIIDRNTLLQRDMRAERQALLQANEELDARSDILGDLLVQKVEEYQQVSARLASLEQENALLAREATSIRELLNRLEERKNTAQSPVPRLRPLESAPTISSDSLSRRPELDIYNQLPDQFSLARGKLPLPVSGRLARKYGSRAEDGETLEGMRIETRSGAIVTSPFAGEVAFAESLGRLGNVFILDVGESYHIIMIGLANLEVTAGESISAGEPIGYMPEINDREQLHFEIRKNREPLNPAQWFLPSLDS